MKGNILVLGNSGVGKSTLINSVLGEDAARTDYGVMGTTKHLQIYGGVDVPFYLIDSVGYEPDPRNAAKAIAAVKKWCKDSVKSGGGRGIIDLVWFCVDGQAKKLFPRTLEHLSKSIAMWKNVPVIVVITKSYSKPERQENIDMVHNAFAMAKNVSCNLKAVIPVVSKTFSLDENSQMPPYGISELIDKSLEVMPEGIENSNELVSRFRLQRKRTLAQAAVAAAVTSAAVVGAVPLPIPDSGVLVTIETAEIEAMCRIYGIKDDKNISALSEAIIAGGAASGIAKAALNALKAVPGLHLAAMVLNSIVAGVIAAAIGESTVFICEQIHLGNIDISGGLGLITSTVSDKLKAIDVSSLVTSIAGSASDTGNFKDLPKTILKAFRKSEKTETD